MSTSRETPSHGDKGLKKIRYHEIPLTSVMDMDDDDVKDNTGDIANANGVSMQPVTLRERKPDPDGDDVQGGVPYRCVHDVVLQESLDTQVL